MTEAPHMTMSDDEIATLNAARDVLDAIGKRALYATPGVTPSQADGMIHVRTEQASEAIFKTLNAANSWWNVQMTYRQLHNCEPVQAAS